MRFHEIIQESFFDGFKGLNGPVEVYLNPSKKEFENIKNAHGANGGVRGFLDGVNLYIWDAYLATHGEVDEALGIWGQRLDWQQQRLVVYWNWDYEDEAYPEGGFDSFEQVQEWIKTVPSCRRLVTGYNIVNGK